MGWIWSQLSTTNYTKGGSRPEIGGGYDLTLHPCDGCRRDFSVRMTLDWVMTGTDWENGSHGPALTITLPTPREKRHWFFRYDFFAYRFHDTVTEPDNWPLSVSQRAQHHLDGGGNIGLIYRF